MANDYIIPLEGRLLGPNTESNSTITRHTYQVKGTFGPDHVREFLAQTEHPVDSDATITSHGPVVLYNRGRVLVEFTPHYE